MKNRLRSDAYAERLLSESLRTLRANLLMQISATDRVLLITSARPQEGKTTIASALAQALAHVGSRVLLVDADLRHPHVHDVFHTPIREGFAELLDGKVTAVDACHLIGSNSKLDSSTSIAAAWTIRSRITGGGLSVLTSGTPPNDPHKLLLGGNLRRILGELRQLYDVVILDSAPVLAVADTLLIAPAVDGIVTVCKWGTVTLSEVQLMRHRLESVHGRIVGSVLNQFPIHGSRYDYPYVTQYASQPSLVAGKRAG